MNLLVLLAFNSCVSFGFLRNSLLFQDLAGFECFQTTEIAFCSICTREPWDVLEDRRDKWDLDPGTAKSILKWDSQGWLSAPVYPTYKPTKSLWQSKAKKFQLFLIWTFFFWYLFIGLSWVFVVEWRLYFSDQGSNLGPLHWELGVFTTGPPAKSPSYDILYFK